MTLEIESRNGDTKVVTPYRFDFNNETKTATVKLTRQSKELKCVEVSRRITEHGIIYSGTLIDLEHAEAKRRFYLFL